MEPLRGSETWFPRLTAKGTGGKRNAKKVLAKLAASHERESICWRQTDLEVLRERGAGSRLTAYLDEVSGRLVPLFSGRSPMGRS